MQPPIDVNGLPLKGTRSLARALLSLSLSPSL